MEVGKGWRKGYNDFSLKMNSALSERWVCCVVENLSRVFLSKQPILLLQVMRVYIIWVKGKKVILKILQVESFVGTSRVGPSRETLVKLIAQHDSSASSMCFSHAFFAGGYSSCELLAIQLRNCTDSLFHTRFFTNLILNLI